jgi:hypothetical protein
MTAYGVRLLKKDADVAQFLLPSLIEPRNGVFDHKYLKVSFACLVDRRTWTIRKVAACEA